MKISELIKQLEEVKRKDGDITVLMSLPYGHHAIDVHINSHATNWDSPILYVFPDTNSKVFDMWSNHLKDLVNKGKI